MALIYHKVWAEGHAGHIFNNFGLVHLRYVPVGQAANFTFLSKFWSIWGIPFARHGWKSGKMIGFWTMTVCLVTSSLQCSNFYWIIKYWPSFCHHILQVSLLIAFDSTWDPRIGWNFAVFTCRNIPQNVTAGSTAMGKEHFQMCLQKWQGWSKLCVCVHASAKNSELFISVSEMAGRVTTYLVSRLVYRSIIWCVELKVFFECTEENQNKRDKDRV